MNQFHIENCSEGDFICKIGEPAKKLYFLQQGEVELLSASGQVFGVIPQGQSFGETAILKGGIRSASIRAKGNVTVKSIDNEDAKNLLSSYSPLLVVVMEALLLQQVMNNAIKYS